MAKSTLLCCSPRDKQTRDSYSRLLKRLEKPRNARRNRTLVEQRRAANRSSPSAHVDGAVPAPATRVRKSTFPTFEVDFYDGLFVCSQLKEYDLVIGGHVLVFACLTVEVDFGLGGKDEITRLAGSCRRGWFKDLILDGRAGFAGKLRHIVPWSRAGQG